MNNNHFMMMKTLENVVKINDETSFNAFFNFSGFNNSFTVYVTSNFAGMSQEKLKPTTAVLDSPDFEKIVTDINITLYELHREGQLGRNKK